MNERQPTLEATAIQSRVTAVGFALALFTFTIGFVMSEAAATHHLDRLGWIYSRTLISQGMGMLLALIALPSLLFAQRVDDSPANTNLQLLAFSVGEVLLYLSLSQFVYSGVENLLSNLADQALPKAGDRGFTASVFFMVLTFFSLVSWWVLILLAPLACIRHAPFPAEQRAPLRRRLVAFYLLALAGIFLASASAYRLRNPEWSFCAAFFAQIAQPVLPLLEAAGWV